MAQRVQRGAAGVVRNILIGLILTMIIIILYASGVLAGWIGGIGLGFTMLLDMNFWSFFFFFVFVVAIVGFCVRTRYNWGGA
jgi:hypothetical protein